VAEKRTFGALSVRTVDGLRNADLQQRGFTAKIKEDLGVDTTGRDFLPFSDLEQSVRDDGETLRNSDLIPDDMSISGAIYDVRSEKLRKVV
jgi:carbonic anhydrase